MSELKPPQQEEFGNIAKAKLIAQVTQQHLEHDIAGHLSEVEGGTSAFIAGAMSILAVKHGIPQGCCALQVSGVRRTAVRAIHGAFAGQRLGAVAVYQAGAFAFKLSTQF